jgi:hypothetical protein
MTSWSAAAESMRPVRSSQVRNRRMVVCSRRADAGERCALVVHQSRMWEVVSSPGAGSAVAVAKRWSV